MRRYVRSLGVSVACAVVLSGAPGIAVAHEVNPSSGSFVTTPSLMAMITPGAVSVTRAAACNSADQYAECISLTPSQGPTGAQVTVNGTGWIDHANRGLDVPINIGMAEVARAHPNADGTFRVGMTIPTTTPEGEVEIDAIIGNGGSATARYTVTGGGASFSQAHPSVTLSPSDGPPGTVTTADGHGFIPNQSVTVTQSGRPGVTGGGGTTRADASGSIKMPFRIADQTPSGVIRVTFTQSANNATAQFRVTSSSPATCSWHLVPGTTWDRLSVDHHFDVELVGFPDMAGMVQEGTAKIYYQGQHMALSAWQPNKWGVHTSWVARNPIGFWNPSNWTIEWSNHANGISCPLA
jgi:hypothetical protein